MDRSVKGKEHVKGKAERGRGKGASAPVMLDGRLDSPSRLDFPSRRTPISPGPRCAGVERLFTRAAIERLFVRAALVCVVLLFALQGCAGEERRSIPSGAQATIDRVTDDVAAGRDEKVYGEAAEEWREAVSAEENARLLGRVRERLGRVEDRTLHTGREQQSASPPLSGHTLELHFNTRFERGAGMERFTLVERDGRWLLAGYSVSSDLLR